jgi:5-formyltetrahydrofolate cyclo-ligase
MREKELLRKKIRKLKSDYSTSQLERMSEEIICRLEYNQHIQSAKTILMYYSLADEVFTHKIINQLALTKNVLLPVVIDDKNMKLRCYENEADLKIGTYGIMEPIGKLFEDYQDIDVAIIPGMSFDTQRHRLGRGKGYYDRFLKQLPDIYKIGLCYEFQLLPKIPFNEYDVIMDEIIC